MQRPRDRLGRPLAHGADLALVFPGVPDRKVVSSRVAWMDANEYLLQGLPFHAHEVLEQRWRMCPPTERDVWRALAQWAAALTHQARGNAKGARQVATRARELLEGCGIVAPIDREKVLDSLTEIIDSAVRAGQMGPTG